MLSGGARISAVDQNGQNFLDDVGSGDMWNFPAGIPHSIQGLEEGSEFLLVFDNRDFSEDSTFLITDWFNCTPKEVLAKNFGASESDFSNLPTDIDRTRYIFQGKVPPPHSSDKVRNPLGERKFSYTYLTLSPSDSAAAQSELLIRQSSLQLPQLPQQ